VPDLGHGLFTAVMLEGLRGEARVVGIAEVSACGLLAYVGWEVDALSMRYFRRPQTVIASAQGRDFPLAAP
jgi:uncharacterized caspase-like protein